MEVVGTNESISVAIDEHGVVVATGDIDLAGGPVLERAIMRREEAGPVVLDLSAVEFIDSSGLRSLLWASRRATERGLQLELRNPSAGVQRLLSLTGTTGQFRISNPDA